MPVNNLIYSSVRIVETNFTLVLKKLSVRLHSWTHVQCQPYIHVSHIALTTHSIS